MSRSSCSNTLGGGMAGMDWVLWRMGCLLVVSGRLRTEPDPSLGMERGLLLSGRLRMEPDPSLGMERGLLLSGRLRMEPDPSLGMERGLLLSGRLRTEPDPSLGMERGLLLSGRPCEAERSRTPERGLPRGTRAEVDPCGLSECSHAPRSLCIAAVVGPVAAERMCRPWPCLPLQGEKACEPAKPHEE